MSASGENSFMYIAAQAYLAHGCSVIPLWGAADPARAKVAVVEWKPYQSRKARPDELRRWFVDAAFPALALVCGPISRRAVLDFDDETAYVSFCQTCPDLVELHVVKSPRGWHIHFQLPPQLSTQSRKFAGGDWLWQGRYVVARPTPGYKLLKGGEPKLLDADELRRIEQFVASRPSSPPLNPLPITWRGDFERGAYLLATQWSGGQGARTEQPAVLNAFNSELFPQHSALSTQYLIMRYRYLAPQLGRNEALFRASLKARDHGWTVDETIRALAEVHVRQVANGEHLPEREANRRKEAVATIYSAFSRPARPVAVRQSSGLPVSVCEALLALRQTCVIRVIAGLRAAGVEADDSLSMPQIVHLLRHQVGEWSIRRALDAQFSNGTLIFTPIHPPSPPPVPSGTASHSDAADYQINASLIGCKNHQEGYAHRPATRYRIPSNDTLLRGLAAKPSGAITFSPDDLLTARATRLALQRELFARRPAQYPVAWQAARLSVCRRTIQAYNHRIPDLQVIPVFGEVWLYPGNLNELPEDNSLKGAFLQDETGKKYPPLRAIAAKLLKQGRDVRYKRQEANYYCIGSPQVMALQRQALGQPVVILKPRRITPPKAADPPPAAQKAVRLPPSRQQPPLPGFFPFQIVKQRQAPPKPPRPKRRRAYRKPLADHAQEALAQQVYDTINRLTTARAERISLVSARKYVDRYGRVLVEAALKLLARRRNIIKPVGFFATVLRSTSKNLR